MDQQLWNQTLVRQLSRMKAKKCVGLVSKLQLPEFETSLQKLRDEYCSSRVSTCLDRISPFISYIQSFHNAISTLVQANPQIAGLIWGSLSAVLICAAKYLDYLDKSTQMIQDITTTLTRFDRYLQLFPSNVQLQSTLRLLYEDYVGFTIELAIFLKRRQAWNVFRMPWSSIKEKFEKSRESIDKNIRKFEMESQVSAHEATIRGIEQIQQYMPRIANAPAITLPFRALTYPKNQNFIGRESELALLDLALQPISNAGIQSCAIHGIAGMGKSQVAIEYTHRHGASFDYIVWLPAQKPIELATAFSSLYTKLSLGPSAAEQQAMIEAVTDWLSRTPKWLLVFDNVEDWDGISSYWPATGNGSILITSQNPAMAQFTTRYIGLTSFSIENGCKLLFKHLNQKMDITGPRDIAVASTLSDDLGGLPMAIAHLAGYISQSQSSLASFEAQFHERLSGSSIWNARSVATTAFHPDALGTLWDIALSDLRDESRRLLEVASFLNPDVIQEKLLLGSRQDARDIAEFDQAIMDLRKRCLIDRYPHQEQPYLSVHRSLQRDIIYKLDKDISRREEILGSAIDLVRQAFPRRDKFEVPDHHKWYLYERYIPHVVRLRGEVDGTSVTPQYLATVADILTDAGHYLWHRGNILDAKGFLEQAEAICLSVPEEMSASTRASALVGLVAVGHTGGFSMRDKIIEQNLEIVRLRTGYRAGVDAETAEILLSNAWHDLGCTYIEAFEYVKAEECLDRSLGIKMAVGTEASMPFEFATEYEDMAYVRLSQGRVADALRLIGDAVRVARMDEAANRSALLQFIFDWAVILLNSGRFEEALEKARESLKGREEMLGEAAIHTLNSAYWVANSLYHLDRLTEAEQMLRSVIKKAETSQWSRENVARIKYRLVQVFAKLGREDEAGSIEHEVRSLYSELRGDLTDFPEPESRSIAVFDSMVSVYFGRSTGELYHGQ